MFIPLLSLLDNCKVCKSYIMFFTKHYITVIIGIQRLTTVKCTTLYLYNLIATPLERVCLLETSTCTDTTVKCTKHLVEECHPNLKSSPLPSYSLISNLLLYISATSSYFGFVWWIKLFWYFFFILLFFTCIIIISCFSTVFSSFMPCITIN